MDEFEIEVTDLRPRKAPSSTQAPAAGRPSIVRHHDEPSDEEPLDEPTHAPLLPLTRLRPVVVARLRGRGRQLRGLGVTLALLLAALIVLTSVPTSREALIAALNIPTPVPTATLAEGADLIIVEHDAPWGELTIDGKARPAPRPVQQHGIPYSLARGQHTVAFRAAPFPTLRCRISVPAAQSDTCPLDTSQQQNGNNPFLNTVRAIDLGAVPSQLSPDDRASLITAANRLLASQPSTTTLQPGEHYLTSDGTPTTAQQPLRAALVSTLATPGAGSVFVGNGQCAPLCDNGFGGGPGLQTSGWPVLAQVSTTWRYTFLDGQTVEGAGTTIAAGGASAAVSFVPLSVTWRDGTGGWDVSPYTPAFSGGHSPFGSFVCGLANADYSTLGLDSSSPLSQSASYQCLTASNPADGCVIAVTPAGPNGQVSSAITDKTAQFLYRFGLLYTANDPARQAAPSFTTADESQQALAQQIVKENGD
jgi:hypothetical protein